MPSKNGKQSLGARPGTRLRGQLEQVYEVRGGRQNVLWLHYSPKAGKDFALSSALHYAHFLFAESDPAIATVNYAPAELVTKIAGESFVSIVAAELQLKTGEVVWRELTSSTDLAKGEAIRKNLQFLIQQQAFNNAPVRHEVLTETEIFACPQRIRNWHRVLPWLAAVRDWALHDYAIDVATLIRRHGRVEFREALALGNSEAASLYGAALLQGVQHGAFLSDLDRMPFTPRSTFYVRESS